MQFSFPIRTALREAWELFLKHPWFYVLMTFVMFALNFIGGKNIIMMLVTTVLAIVWSYVMLSVALAAIDNKEELLSINALAHHIPKPVVLLKLVAVGLVTGALTLLGFVLLIIPGIYIAVRFSFANLAFVDRKGGIKDAVDYSWNLVEGKFFWKVLLVGVISAVLMIVGFVFFVVGLLVAYPIIMLVQAKLYRALAMHHNQDEQIVVQPEELPEPSTTGESDTVSEPVAS